MATNNPVINNNNEDNNVNENLEGQAENPHGFSIL